MVSTIAEQQRFRTMKVGFCLNASTSWLEPSAARSRSCIPQIPSLSLNWFGVAGKSTTPAHLVGATIAAAEDGVQARFVRSSLGSAAHAPALLSGFEE